MVKNQTNLFAILSLVFAFLFFPLGLIFGGVALRQIKKTKEEGKGLAIAGIVVSLIPIVILVMIIMVFIFTARVGLTPNTSEESINNVQKTATQALTDVARGEADAESFLEVKIIEKKTFKQVGQSFGETLIGKRSSGTFLIITIEVTNNGDEPIYITSSDILMFDKNNRKFAPDTEAMLYLSDAFVFEIINPGITQKGKVVFDVQDPKTEYSLIVHNNVLSLFD